MSAGGATLPLTHYFRLGSPEPAPRLRHLRPGSARASVPAPPGGLLLPVLLLVHGTRTGANTTRNPKLLIEKPGPLTYRYAERQ